MELHRDIHKAAQRMAFAAACIALAVIPHVAAEGQVTPSAETPIIWTDLGATRAPAQPTKASRSAFATRIATQIGPSASEGGQWATMSDGTEVWTAGIRSAGAASMSIEIDGIDLPEGGEISVWGADGQSKSVDTETGMSPIVDGEWVAIQYTGPAGANPRFNITAAYCGFKRIGDTWAELEAPVNKAIGQGSSQTCEVNAQCCARADTIGRAVCRLIVNNANLGTGTLINNTAGDRSPLVLTSAHVIASSKLRSCTALFGFSEPFCAAEGYYSQGSDQIDGAELVAFDAATDMAVLKLKRTPSLTSSPYWAGWERTGGPAEGLLCVHHPHGDTQKASEAASATARTTYNTSDRNATGGSFRANAFWRIGQWTTGATEGGSSGSSLIDASGHVIGALSGGMATCKSPKDDWFWMLSAAWDKSSDGYATLGEALDPLGSGATSMGGIDGLATAEGGTRLAASHDPRGEVSSTQLTIGGINESMVQSVPTLGNGTNAKIWAIRLYAATEDDADRLASEVEVGVGSAVDMGETSFSAASEVPMGMNTIVDYVFGTAVDIGRSSDAAVLLRARDDFQGDGIVLMAVETAADGREASVRSGGQWTKAGSTLAVSVIYTQTGDTHDTAVSTEGSVRVRCDDGTVTLSGEAISAVAIYDRQGRLRHMEGGKGRTEISIDMCGAATGLYVVRVLCESGKQKTFKILNT